ncbi:MAG: hypothetical protein KatS3mg059_0918 [Thermomicrobiales bacterium]|nr:MAG: hypothetical protein KatS3mg059_0918 [Thermomicrobiales bacterium]
MANGLPMRRGGTGMAVFILLTEVAPAAANPGELAALGDLVTERLRVECPQARWLASYATFGPWDYLDIFEAPDETIAAQVAMIVRGSAPARTVVWPAIPWEQFRQMLRAATTGQVPGAAARRPMEGEYMQESDSDSLVTEASEASFPASDPPSYTTGRQHRTTDDAGAQPSG